MRRLGPAVSVALLFGCASAPSRASLADLVTFLRDVHPNVHRYVEADELDSLVASEAATLGPEARTRDVARAVQRVLAAVGDAHLVAGGTSGVPPGPRFPLVAVRAGSRIFVDASDPELPLGTELLGVEGIAAPDLLAELAGYASVDGDRPEVRLAEAERHFAELATLALGDRDEYTVEIRRPGEAPTSITLPASDAELGALRRSAPRWGSRASPWPSVRTHGPVTILELASFGVPDEEEYESRVDALFEDIPSDAPLALDLRGNEGGLRTHGVAVLHHLLAEPFVQWTRVETRVRAIPDQHASRVSYPIAPESALTGFPGAREGAVWVFEGDPLADGMRPTGPAHAGPLFVFVDDATSSAAVELVAALLAHRDGVRVIGTETQGECGRHTGQMPVLYDVGEGVGVLASLFEITLVAYDGCEPGRGVVPDVEVTYEASHFLEARDPFLEALDAM